MGTDALPPTEGTTLAGALSRVENFEGDSVVTLNEAEAKALWEELQRLRAAPEPAAERLTLCLQAIMADLADLLDADQFNNIEARVMAAGVPYPPLGTDPAEIEAIERAGLRDPIGGFLNGQWFAEAQSLTQFRGGTKYKVKA